MLRSLDISIPTMFKTLFILKKFISVNSPLLKKPRKT